MVTLPRSLVASACGGGNEDVEPFDSAEEEGPEGMTPAPEPRRGDGNVDPGEVCDDRRYCSSDCLSVEGSCGDGVVQRLEECDTGGTEHPGCVECRRSFSYVCSGEPSVCEESGLPRDLRLSDVTQEEYATFCTWYLEVLGGAGTSINCGYNNKVLSIVTQEQCLTIPLSVWGACTIGEFTDWVASFDHVCVLNDMGDAPCARQSAEP